MLDVFTLMVIDLPLFLLVDQSVPERQLTFTFILNSNKFENLRRNVLVLIKSDSIRIFESLEILFVSAHIALHDVEEGVVISEGKWEFELA